MTEKKIPVPTPLFIGAKEISFFDSIAKEMIQRVIGQHITYYSVSEEHTNSHPLYNEAISKTVFTPIDINALILYGEPDQTNTQFTIDTIYNIEVYFHTHELEERNVVPREGDFVKWGTVIYEISKLTEPQLVFGQINEKVMKKAECVVSRKSQFDFE